MNSFYLFINIPPKKILYQMKYLFFRSRDGTALFLLFCFVFTGVRLVYNLVLVSAVQSESAVCVCIDIIVNTFKLTIAKVLTVGLFSFFSSFLLKNLATE